MLFLVGCGGGIDMALITDTGTIHDGSFNQGAYEGMVRYAQETDKEYKVYEPAASSKSELLKSIKQAVSDGADVIICPGVLFEEAVYTAQKKYKNVEFIIIDGEPHDSSYNNYDVRDNTMPILFSEEQAGFLAGYAAVRDNNTELGFLGGMNQDSVIKYGYGFVQGADYAAIEMGVDVNIKYCYTNTFLESEEAKSLAERLYMHGTSVIFACGGSMGKSVIAAAEITGGKVIGVDSDQSGISKTVITSAKKSLANAVYTGVSNYYDETLIGGTVYRMDAANDGISLEMEQSRFDTFSEVEYDAIYAQLVSGRIVPYASSNYGNCSDLELVNTTVDFLEMSQNE